MPNKQSPLIIALTGPLGSGVTTLSHVLASYGFHRVSLSEPIKDEYRKRHKMAAGAVVPKGGDARRELQDIGDEGRKECATKWLDAAMPAQLPDLTVVDCVRNNTEIDALRDRHTNVYVVAVVAERSTRWERSKNDYANEAEFIAADERDDEGKGSPHGQQVGRCVNEADYVLVNNHHRGASNQVKSGLWDEIKTDIEVMRGKDRRDPRDQETHMAVAYTASHLSKCMKRHVGAVIVNDVGLPISTGFNENPVGTKPCVVQWNYCFKDNAMEDELERRGKSHCTKCGTLNQPLADPWKCGTCKDNLKRQLFPSRNMEKCTAIHAEERAIRSLGDRPARGSTMYVTTFPCLQCSRYILDAGIKKIVYVEAYPVAEARDFLAANNVEIESFSGFKARAFNIVFKPGS